MGQQCKTDKGRGRSQGSRGTKEGAANERKQTINALQRVTANPNATESERVFFRLALRFCPVQFGLHGLEHVKLQFSTFRFIPMLQ